jgi:hypothetical protein
LIERESGNGVVAGLHLADGLGPHRHRHLPGRGIGLAALDGGCPRRQDDESRADHDGKLSPDCS